MCNSIFSFYEMILVSEQTFGQTNGHLLSKMIYLARDNALCILYVA